MRRVWLLCVFVVAGLLASSGAVIFFGVRGLQMPTETEAAAKSVAAPNTAGASSRDAIAAKSDPTSKATKTLVSSGSRSDETGAVSDAALPLDAQQRSPQSSVAETLNSQRAEETTPPDAPRRANERPRDKQRAAPHSSSPPDRVASPEDPSKLTSQKRSGLVGPFLRAVSNDSNGSHESNGRLADIVLSIQGAADSLGAFMRQSKDLFENMKTAPLSEPIASRRAAPVENPSGAALPPTEASGDARDSDIREGDRKTKTPTHDRRVELLVLMNAPSSGGEVTYLVDRVVFSLKPGERHVLTAGASRRIQFHRGGDFGDAEVTAAGGAYLFDVTERGWDLRGVGAADEVQ